MRRGCGVINRERAPMRRRTHNTHTETEVWCSPGVIQDEEERSDKTTEVIHQKTTAWVRVKCVCVCEVTKTGGMCRRGILDIYMYIRM